MAVAPTRGYQRGSGSGGTAAFGGASAEAFGAPIGQALEQGGAELTQDALRAKRLELARQRQADGAAAAVRFATATGELRTAINEQRQQAAPGAGGHVETVTVMLGRLDQLVGEIPNEQVRQAFAERAAEYRSRVIAEEDGWARGQRLANQVSNIQETTRLLSNQIQVHPDPQSFEENLATIRTGIRSQGLAADLADGLEREEISKLANSYLTGLNEQDPVAARQILQSGLLNQYLTTEQIARLTDNADTEIRVREADARRVQAAAAAAGREHIDLVQRRLADHDPTLTEADLDEADRLARAGGLGTEVYDLAKARVQRRVDQEYRNSTPIEIAAAINTISARVAQAGDRASPADVIARDHLQSLLTRRTQQTQNDPLSAYAAGGGVVAPVDFADRASVRTRVTAARAAERQTGFFSLFTPQEEAQLREQYETGVPGRMALLAQLDAVAREDPQAALRAATEIAPNDATFRHALRVNAQVRDLVIRGREARRTLPARVVREDGTASTVDAESHSWFATYAGPSLRVLPPADVNDVLEAARNIYAELRRRDNEGGQQFDPRRFNNAVNLALGQTRSGGGLGWASYGPRAPNGQRHGVLLPAGMSQAEFDQRLAGLPIARLGEGWPRGAANGTPVSHGDGRNISTDVLRNNFVPVAVRDGVYQFRWGSQAVTTREGRVFELDIRRLPPRSAMLSGASGTVQVRDRRAPVYRGGD